MAAASNARPLLTAALCLTFLLPPQIEAAIVLQYHHVSDQTPPSTSVSPSRFEMHLDYLDDHGFEVVPLQALVDALRDGEPLPDRVAAITFDDGYSSVYGEAFPRLAERGWPFTVFVNTEPHDHGRPGFMSWDQLREMSRRGGTIANHTISHPHLLERGAGEDKWAWQTRVSGEITGAQLRITQEIGMAPLLLAYPYGEYDRAVLEIAAGLGFTGFGQQSGPLASYSDPRALPRFPFGGPYGDPDDFATKVDSLPLPLDATETPIRWQTADGKPLADTVLRGPAPLPVLLLAFPASFDPRGLTCFATGQGAITVSLEDRLARVAANRPLNPGRSRYNCTARSQEPGRHYWFSQPWLYLDPGRGQGPDLSNPRGDSP